jgi:putative intracellular protease/amidase
MVLTGAKVWTMKNGSPHPCGYWAREFIEAHQAFTDAALSVTIATPGGITPTVDPLSFALAYNNNDANEVARQKAYLEANAATLNAPARLEDMRATGFDVIFLVGGHGPMQDMAVHPTIGDLLATMLDDPKKVVSSVCHGSAGFLSAHRADGAWLFRGRKLTGFTNEEENMATFAGNAPWLLEDRLRLAGAIFDGARAYTTHVVVDGNLVTGQQNLSAGAVAKAVLEKLGVARHIAAGANRA